LKQLKELYDPAHILTPWSRDFLVANLLAYAQATVGGTPGNAERADDDHDLWMAFFHSWPSTSVRRAAAIFPDSGEGRTFREHR
jgi:hypothetical protein